MQPKALEAVHRKPPSHAIGAAVAQSWLVLERIREIAGGYGGSMADVVKLVQYFRDLRHYPFYNRVRGLFYPGEPPVSTVVEVSRFMPGDGALIEVEATIYLPQQRTVSGRP